MRYMTQSETTPHKGLALTIFQLKPCNSSQLLLKFRFFMSRQRKNSARDKEIGKKWIYLEDTCLYSPNHFLAFYGWTDLAPLGVSFINR